MKILKSFLLALPFFLFASFASANIPGNVVQHCTHIGASGERVAQERDAGMPKATIVSRIRNLHQRGAFNDMMAMQMLAVTELVYTNYADIPAENMFNVMYDECIEYNVTNSASK